MKRIAVLLLLFGIAGAEEVRLDGFLILPPDASEGKSMTVGSTIYRAKRVGLDGFVKSCRVESQDNFNSVYEIRLKTEPTPAEGFHGLILRGRGYTLVSQSYGSSDGKLSEVTFQVDTETAAQVAGAFGVALLKREHPGYMLRTRFVVEGDGVRLEMTNVGKKPVTFMDGGMNRGARNNQFSFVGYRDADTLPDIGSATHFGGLSVYVTLEPGETFRKEVDLSKWFDLSGKHFFQFLGTYFLEFHASQRDHRILWTDHVAAEFVINRR